MPLRVMTYNIRHGLGHDATGGDVRVVVSGLNLERTAEVIWNERPDIVAVQEVDRFWDRSRCVDQPKALARMLGMEVCFGANLVTPRPDSQSASAEYGTAILSRYPIRRFDNTQLPVDDGWEPRGLLHAEIETPVGLVVAINTHLQIGFGDREADGTRQRVEQARSVSRVAADIYRPLVVMGDFNAEPGDPEIEPLVKGDAALTDAWTMGGGDGFTIPAHPKRDALKRIDLILVNRRWSVRRARVVTTFDARMSSDHLPVVADLDLNG